MKIVIDTLAQEVGVRERTHMVTDDTVAEMVAGCQMAILTLRGKPVFSTISHFEIEFDHNSARDETFSKIKIFFQENWRRPGPSTEASFELHKKGLGAIRGEVYNTILTRLIEVFRAHQRRVVDNGETLGDLVACLEKAKSTGETKPENQLQQRKPVTCTACGGSTDCEHVRRAEHETREAQEVAASTRG